MSLIKIKTNSGLINAIDGQIINLLRLPVHLLFCNETDQYKLTTWVQENLVF